MRHAAIRPEGNRAPAVDAPTLRRWLDRGRDDEGRELVLLDTRNDYETDVGRFAGAVDYRLRRFTDFPAAVAADRERYAGRTVVSYCTGGIRCEKAALHMRELGIERAFQLDGGILKYFELTDGAHWQGDCFVFDGRGAVDKTLAPAAVAAPHAASEDGRVGASPALATAGAADARAGKRRAAAPARAEGAAA
jgi:UPF0176 protein